MKRSKFFVPIAKVDPEQRMVYGYASTESVDNQGEIIKVDALKDALNDYMQYANVREMHQPSAVGICKQAEIDNKGLYVGVKVVADEAWKKVKEGVYKGFSVGGEAISKVDKTISKMRLVEISLVDRPCNPEATFDLWKMDGAPDVQKGMYEVSSLADFLVGLNCLRQSVDAEALFENDSSPIGSRLKDAIDALAGILVEMTQEETAELTAKMASASSIQKAGARNSKGDIDRIQKMHDLAVELGASCGKPPAGEEEPKPETKTEKSDSASELAKMLQSAVDSMAQVASDIKKMTTPLPSKVTVKVPVNPQSMEAGAEAIQKILERVKKLEQQPEPAKVVLKTVTKDDDAAPPINKTDVGKDPAAQADELLPEIRKALQSPTSAY